MADASDQYFDQPGRPGGYPSVPTLDTPFGTPTAQPDPSTGGSPYFGLGETLNAGTTTASADTGGGFNWDAYPASDSSGFSAAPQAAFTSGSSGYGGVFAGPSGVDLANDPGYQFRIDQANKATQASAFARGLGNTGGTQKAISQAVQDQASAEYSNVFNRALQGFTENANVGLANASLQNQNAAAQNQNAQFNAGLTETHNQNQFGNYYNLAGLGLSATDTGVGALGQYGTNTANLATGYGNTLANLYAGQGNTSAAGSVAQGNIYSGLPGTLAGVGQAYVAGNGLGTSTSAPFIPIGGNQSITSLGQTGR